MWVLDQLWCRLAIDTAIAKVARGRKLDAGRLERVLFALVASRALAPSSKLEVVRRVTDDVHVDGFGHLTHTDGYRAMEFLLEALGEMPGGVHHQRRPVEPVCGPGVLRLSGQTEIGA